MHSNESSLKNIRSEQISRDPLKFSVGKKDRLFCFIFGWTVHHAQGTVRGHQTSVEKLYTSTSHFRDQNTPGRLRRGHLIAPKRLLSPNIGGMSCIITIETRAPSAEPLRCAQAPHVCLDHGNKQYWHRASKHCPVTSNGFWVVMNGPSNDETNHFFLPTENINGSVLT